LHEIFEKFVGSVQIVIKEGVYREHIRFLLSKADVIGKILKGFTDECQRTPLTFVNRTIDKSQDIWRHENGAKVSKEEEPSNACILAIGKSFHHLSLEMFGDHSKRGRADPKRVQNNVQNFLALYQQSLHIFFHVSFFALCWIDFIQCRIFFHKRLHKGFKNNVKVVFPQNSSKRSHQFGGRTVPSKESGVVLSGCHLPGHGNSEERDKFSVRVQDPHHHLDNLFVSCTRCTNGSNEGKVWMHEHLDEIIFQRAELVAVSIDSLLNNGLDGFFRIPQFSGARTL